MKNSYFKGLTVLALVLSLFACDSTKDDQLKLLTVASKEVSGYTITLKAERPLEVGMNVLFWEVKDAMGGLKEMQSLSVTPIMDMTTMTHSCPRSSPQQSSEVHRHWKNEAVFTMPSGTMGTWAIDVVATLADGAEVRANIPVTIASSWKLASVRLNNVPHYWVWELPETPRVGNATYRLRLYKRISMMEYAPVNDAVATVYPYMDMGGGSGHSTTFTEPVSKGNGVYEGTVNFSMAGEWSFTVRSSISGAALPDAVMLMNVIAR